MGLTGFNRNRRIAQLRHAAEALGIDVPADADEHEVRRLIAEAQAKLREKPETEAAETVDAPVDGVDAGIATVDSTIAEAEPETVDDPAPEQGVESPVRYEDPNPTMLDPVGESKAKSKRTKK